jgi:ribosomal protein S18 acetylase RimI-like enzyme
MVKRVDLETEYVLYQYFIKTGKEIPFYFPVDYDTWHKSMFNDETEEGKPLFDNLETYLYYEDETLKGFIQFGISSFVFYQDGSDYGKDFSKHYAIIRNIHYLEDSKNPEELLEKAFEYFNNMDFEETSAFFHYFGMSCYAKHGKLHESIFYIENLLHKYSFKKGHENVYYSKDLDAEKYSCDPEISYKINEIMGNRYKMDFFVNNKQIGYCEYAFLHNSVCYLYTILIHEEHRRKGFGARCMNILFYISEERKIKRMDLDTIDPNYIAQSLYEKIGLKKKGITRSYSKED